MSEPTKSPETHDLVSEAVGDTFRIFVGQCGADPQATLYVTDANGLFGLTVDTVRMMQLPGLLPSMRIVGIGYPDADMLADTFEIRTRDLTPSPSKHMAGSGHGDSFAAFIGTELSPWLRDRYSTDPAERIYFGHSLGGLFGTYSMLTKAGFFDRYIVSSPSLWWDHEMIFDVERRDQDRSLNTSAFFGIGSLETDAGRRLESAKLPDGHPGKAARTPLDMVADLRRFLAQLESRRDQSLQLAHLEVADEFHATVAGTILSRALRHFYD